MDKRSTANSAAASKPGCRQKLGGSALALLAMAWAGAPGDVLADTIVLKSGEVLEGSIIQGTRNTVIVERAVGGMRQMPIRDIAEVRVDLARGQTVSGQLLSWTDGVYQVRSGGQIIRISEGDVLSREPGDASIAQAPREEPPQPVGQQTVRMATAPATAAVPERTAAGAVAARAQPAAQEPQRGDRQDLAAGNDQSPAAGARELQSPAAGDERGQAAAGEDQSPAAGEAQNLAAADEDQSAVAGRERGPTAGDEEQSPAGGEERTLAARGENQSQTTEGKESLAIKASVDPPEPGADRMVFRIELSRPAEQTVVLVYGTVEGTAKAGEDFEPQQGVVTLAPGAKSAEVHVPLVERPSATGEKRFELFLAADPKVAEVVDKRVVATINGSN